MANVEIPSTWEMESCFTLIALAESFEIHRERLANAYQYYGQWTRMRLALGAFVSAADLERAHRVRHQLSVRFNEATAGVDALVSTGSLRTAPPLGDKTIGKYDTWEKRGTMSFVNLLGLPSLTLATGYSPEGLPMAMQIIGKPFAEEILYGIGHAYERSTTWKDVRPRLSALLKKGRSEGA